MSAYSKSTLLEYNTDPEVFQDMDKFNLSEAKDFALSVKLQFPKFSRGHCVSNFDLFIKSYIGEKNVVALGRLSFPNEWQMQVKDSEIREKLIRLNRLKINSRTCWISPLSPAEVRGFIHWIPNAIKEETLCHLLEPYGEVLFMEVQKENVWSRYNCDSRYFALNLKPGQTKEDIPHFFRMESHYGLITIRGRAPSCFHCKKVGHRKSECEKYKEKLYAFCNREPGSGAVRSKPRGKRYHPTLDADPGNAASATTTKKKRKKSKANKGNQTVENASKAVNTEESPVVQPQENSAIGVQANANAGLMPNVEELIRRLTDLCDNGVARKMSELQSELSEIAINLQKVKITDTKGNEDKDVPLENNGEQSVKDNEDKDVPLENNGEPSAEVKKKKRKKKKKKAAPAQVSDEAIPHND